MQVASLFADLGAHVNPRGFEQYDRELKQARAESKKAIEARLGGDVDERAFRKYNEALDHAHKQATRRDAFKAELKGDYDSRAFRQYERALRDVDGQHRGLIRGNARLRSSFGTVWAKGGAALGAIGVAYGLGIAIRGIATATVDFDKGMRNVNSIAQLSEKELQKLSKEVLGLAGKTAQSPKTLAAGLYDIVSSGFKAKEAMTILGASARAATAGLTTTEVSTKAVVSVLNAYRRPASDASAISDVLFKTVDRGVISFEELSTTIGQTLPFASNLKVPITDLGAAMATMTKEGLDGAEASTRLRNVMVAMLKPGDALKETIKGLGFNSGEALIKSKGLQGALDLLSKSTHGNKAEMALLFPNVRALGGALALTGANSRGANKDLREMGKSGGATGRALSQQAQSISYQWNKAKAQLSAAAITLGNHLVPTVVKVSRWVNKFTQEMQEGRGEGGRFARRLEQVAKAAEVAAKAIAILAKAMDLVVKVMFTSLRMLPKFIDGLFRIADGALAALGAVAKAADGIPLLGKAFKGASKGIDAARDALKDARAAILGTKKPADEAGDATQRLAKRGRASMKDLQAAVSGATRNAKSHLIDDSGAGAKGLTKNFDRMQANVRKSMGRAKEAVADGLESIRGQLNKQLTAFGMDPISAKELRGAKPLGRNPPRARGGRVKEFAGGGYFGGKGMVGRDMIPFGDAVVAPGEFYAPGPGGVGAVLSRHQQLWGNLALLAAGGNVRSLDELAGTSGDQMGILNQALQRVGMGGLTGLFSRVTRPHYLASGGLLGAIGAANRLERASFPYVWGGGHQGTPAPFGPMDCSGAVSYVLQQAGVNIPTMTSGAMMRAGQPGPGALTIYATPAHVLMRIAGGPNGGFFGTSRSNPGGGAGWISPPGAGYLAGRTVRHFAGGEGIGAVDVKVPQVTRGGALGAIMQAVLNTAGRGANKAGNALLAAMGGGGDAEVSAGHLSKAQLAALWIRAGGPRGVANTAAAIALAESGGDPKIVNSIGASGLWQIHPAEPGSLNALQNARQAVRKYSESGWRPWEAYTKGAYRKFLQSGGRTRPSKKTKWGSSIGWAITGAERRNDTSGLANAAAILGLRSSAKLGITRIDETIPGQIESLTRQYTIQERKYNMSDEILVDPETGAVNVAMVEKRAHELDVLAGIREHIVRRMRALYKALQGLISNYKTLIKRLNRSLRWATKKQRSGIKAQITGYKGEVKERSKQLRDLGFDIQESELDVQDVRNEAAEVRATGPGEAAAAGADAGAADAGAADASPDLQAQTAQAQEALRVSQENLRLNVAALKAFSGPGDIGQGGASALGAVNAGLFGSTVGVAGPGGVAAGVSEAPTIVQNIYTLVPSDPATLRAVGDAAASGIAYQPSVPSSTVTTGF